MRALILLAMVAIAARVDAQSVVAANAPQRLAVTIYRNPERGPEPMNLDWLGGYALVSETRHVRLPAGTSEVRFEGVTSGIVPQSAIVTGLGDAVIEKNRDARLLSPGALLDASLGERLHLRRTDKATGKVREQDAIVRATSDGIVLQTEGRIEALRCTGLPETLLADRVPVGLSAKPTLSVIVRSPQPVERTVTLSYITNNFDWQSDYIAELSESGDTMSLFGWMSIANGDQTSLANAQTQAVAGWINRMPVKADPGEAKPITISCWPQGTTSDIPEDFRLRRAEEITVAGVPPMAMAPPPAPPPGPGGRIERDSGYMAREERLGDVRLYRAPIEVTVAAKSQKQIALFRKPSVKVSSYLRLRPGLGQYDPAVERVLVTRNRAAEGLGLALPAGKIVLFAKSAGRRILFGEVQVSDFAVGEKVEIPIAISTGVRAHQVTERLDSSAGPYRLTLTNDLPSAQVVEVQLPPSATALLGGPLVKLEGWMIWRVTLPANGTAEIRYRV